MRLEDAMRLMEDGDSAYAVPQEQLVAVLETLERRGLPLLAGSPASVRRFLYATALRFDRWAAPTPFVVEPQAYDLFERFLRALTHAEPSNSENVSVLQVHRLQNRLFRSLPGPLGGTEPAPVETSVLKAELQSLQPPGGADKRAEFDRAVGELDRLLHGAASGGLQTVLQTSLPHPVLTAVTAGRCIWRDQVVSFRLTPQTSPSATWKASPGATVLPTGSSRWPAGSCDVELRLSALLDVTAPVSALYGLPGPVGRPTSKDTLGLAVAYHVLHDVLWTLQQADDQLGALWLPVPRDLEQITSYVETADGSRLLDKTQVQGGWAVRTGSAEQLEVDLGDVEPPEHWQLCRAQASSHLSLGATREALLWLNMAVEALLDARMASLCEQTGQPELLEQLQGSQLLFAEAEETLAAQFPEMAGRVEWPSRTVQPSRYAQLKGLQRGLSLAAGSRELQRLYSVISRGRNPVVHGRRRDQVPADEVVAGLTALDRLEELLVL